VNNYRGFFAALSPNNTIYRNNFINNTVQATLSASYSNTWDYGYPSGGNYWSDYTGVDYFSGPFQNGTGSDGIGDTPYVINVDNRDNYPLMKPYGGPHDIGITSVTTSKTIIVQGYSLNINTSIINYGVETETFNVTIYANTTVINQTQITLTSRSSTTITLTWNTTGVSLGTYTISAHATPVQGETDTADNTHTDGTVKIVKNPVAAFTYSPTTPLTGQTVTFNATLSTPDGGTIISYEWNFGDGTNATGKFTTHTYTDNGTYAVTLTVTDDDGLTDTDSQNITVLNRPPIASFTESATTVPTGTIITFNASTSYDPDGSIVSYFWNFGDGTNTTGMTVNHAYANNGNYTVTLTVKDNDGASASASSTKTVLNRPPVALFTESATKVYTGTVIYFDASGSYDPDGTILKYFWDFGDGTNGTGVVATHAYADDDIYVVTLTVTDDDGEIASTTATKTVLNRAPIALFTESSTMVLTGEVITFNASDSYDQDGFIVSYLWDFGDGSNASGVIVNHLYADDGVYNVTLTVTDDDGATTSTSATKTILNRPPVAEFTESETTVFTGEVINFNASDSYDLDGTIISYFWDFGDGINATGVVVDHSYADDGNYTVALTVTDNDGATDTATSTKTVLNRPPVASFTESAETVLTGETISFNASASSDPDGFIVSYFWDFGDGTNATGVTVDHAYIDDGNYTVTLTVTDDDGTTDTANSTKTVLNRPPVAIFSESAETVYTDENINFNASTSYDSDGVILSYFWDFGDGTNATGVLVNHAYAGNGTYTVTLTVTDDDGASTSTKAIKTVLNRPDIAVKNVTTFKTVVGQGYNVSISVTVENQGDYTETFNVTIYADKTSISQTEVYLASGHSTVLTFTWNTTGVAKGNHTITVEATQLPGETDLDDNTLEDGWIIVAMIGDLTGPNGYPDRKCDMRDVYLVARGFGAEHITDPNDHRHCQYWHKTPCSSCPHTPNIDINNDGKIDMRDIYVVARNFGKTDP